MENRDEDIPLPNKMNKNKEGVVKGKEISAKEAYFVSLNAWVKNANISQNAMAMFPWYLLSSYPQLFQAGLGAPASSTDHQRNPNMLNSGINVNANRNANAGPAVGFNSLRILDDQMQIDLINRVGGYEYVIAPFWKRAIAELVDIIILLLLKVMVTFTIMNIFDLDLGFDLDKEAIHKVLTDTDYSGFLTVSMDFLALSSDLLMLEILTKIIVCFYEAICTTMNVGATPGKALMSLRIQYVEAVVPLQPPQPPQIPQFGIQHPRVPVTALIYPAETPTFMRALVRAVAKNVIMTLLFPMCFLMVFFKNNRTAYDIITKTIVVEANPNPTLRRQR